jgi:hypothetical protein
VPSALPIVIIRGEEVGEPTVVPVEIGPAACWLLHRLGVRLQPAQGFGKQLLQALCRFMSEGNAELSPRRWC